MIAALNAALAGGMVSFVQTVPPDIKNVMVSDLILKKRQSFNNSQGSTLSCKVNFPPCTRFN